MAGWSRSVRPWEITLGNSISGAAAFTLAFDGAARQEFVNRGIPLAIGDGDIGDDVGRAQPRATRLEVGHNLLGRPICISAVARSWPGRCVQGEFGLIA